MVKKIIGVLALGCAFVLTGCLGTTHHFNTGRLLKSGKYSYTYGYSQGGGYKCAGVTVKNSDKQSYCRGDVEPTNNIVVSRSFRLGVRDQWWIFPGLEIGYQIEIPHTLEFDARLAMPNPFDSTFAHSVSTGWGVGLYPDNTYFLEYALSKKYGSILLYANTRSSWMATQARDLAVSDSDEQNNSYFKQNRTWRMQMSIGVEKQLPEIDVVPDFVNLQVHFLTPVPGTPGEALNLGSDAPLASWQINGGLKWAY